jgi:hypothetical protein
MQQKSSARVRTTSLESLARVTDTFYISSIMTPSDEFEYCKPQDLLTEKLNVMKHERFDVIPFQTGKNQATARISYYLDQDTMGRKLAHRCKYCECAAVKMGQEDLINDVPFDEIIHRFSSRIGKPKIPLFVENRFKQIIGLITPADLDKIAFKMYLFCLISELEVSLLRIVSKDYESIREICDCRYCLRKRKNRKGKKFHTDGLEEYHYLCLKELLHLFTKSKNLGQVQEKIRQKLTSSDCDSIATLRNNVSHPKPLVSSKFPMKKLDETHNLIKDLILTCKGTEKTIWRSRSPGQELVILDSTPLAGTGDLLVD